MTIGGKQSRAEASSAGTSSLGRDPARRRQRYPRPGDKLIGFVEQPLRHAPEGEIDRAALLPVIERRKGFGLLEDRAVVVLQNGKPGGLCRRRGLGQAVFASSQKIFYLV